MTTPLHYLQIGLPPELYQLLCQRAQALGQSPEGAVLEAVQSWLDPQGLVSLEKRLENLIDRRIAALRAEFLGVTESKPSVVPPYHPLRPLQVGDIVQIREAGSPYYLEKLPITKVGIIRAYVATREGERSFLKRDLRLVEPQPNDYPEESEG
ncbi:MAG: hypothetical protein ACK421_08285 [Pseudanabaenaceae cyanobacterium]